MIRNRVLVLGGNGFIGKNICNYFNENGWKVTSFDIVMPKEQENGISYIEGDFFDTSFLQTIVNNQDLIIHSISTVTPGNSNIKFMNGYQYDLVQTARLCEMLVGTDTKMIFLSSGGTVYGNQKVQPISENAATSPINHYGCLKTCIENIIRTFNIQFKTDFLIARIANPYGPGQDYKKGVGFVDAALKKSLNHDTIEIWGDGETVRDYIHIKDVCGMIFSLAYFEGEFDTFNLSSGIGISQNDVLNVLKGMNIDFNVNYMSARNIDVKKIVLDNSKIMSIYNKELISFETGIEDYYNYLLNF